MNFNEKLDIQASGNFDEVNLKSLTEGEIPAHAYRMVEYKHGVGENVIRASEEAMKKTAKMLLE